MKFKPMTRRFRVPNTDVVIQFARDEDGDVDVTIDHVRGTIELVQGVDDDAMTIAALGFPTAEDEPPVETLVEVPA